MSIKLATACVAVIAVAAFLPSAYAESTQTQRINVAYGDLDLNSAAGAQTLDARIDEAARRACGGSPTFQQQYRDARTWVRSTFEACRADAVRDAEAELSAARTAASASINTGSR